MIRHTTIKLNGKRLLKAMLGDINLKQVRQKLLQAGIQIEMLDQMREISGTPSLTIAIFSAPSEYDAIKKKRAVLDAFKGLGIPVTLRD